MPMPTVGTRRFPRSVVSDFREVVLGLEYPNSGIPSKKRRAAGLATEEELRVRIELFFFLGSIKLCVSVHEEEATKTARDSDRIVG